MSGHGTSAIPVVEGPQEYYVPHEGSNWPIIACIGVATLLIGASNLLNGASIGELMMYAGLAVIVFMFFGWFRQVINESMGGLYERRMDYTFRWSMGWFIFSEVMFFGAFFGALYYARTLSIPWLGGEGNNFSTNFFLWSGYEKEWPTNGPAELGGAFMAMAPWGDMHHGFKEWFWHSLPLVNTLILLTSGVTLTMSHHAIFAKKNNAITFWLLVTVLLGVAFLGFQAYEYSHAYSEMNLTLGAGIYGSTFYMLTGFHGMHVTLGTVMLMTQLGRAMKGHFTPENHFSFEAVAWYWHFVDVVWLGLFIFVYVI